MLVNACNKTACLKSNRLALFFSIQFLQQSRVHAARDFARGVVENQQESQKLAAVDNFASEIGKILCSQQTSVYNWLSLAPWL